MQAQLQEWFTNLEQREQILLKIGAVAVVLAILIWGIWHPLNTAITQQESLLHKQQKLAVWVAKQKAKVATLSSAQSRQANLQGSIVQAVNSTASYNKIALTRLQPNGDQVQVWIDEVEFGTLMKWLDSLEKTGLNVMQIDIAQTGELGTVKVRRLELIKA